VGTGELTSVAHRLTLAPEMALLWLLELDYQTKTWNLYSSTLLAYMEQGVLSQKDVGEKGDTWSTQKENVSWKGVYICASAFDLSQCNSHLDCIQLSVPNVLP